MFGYYLGENPIEIIVDKFFLLDFPLNNNETSVYYVVKRVTRGREGVKNDEKSSDVICECPLREGGNFGSLRGRGGTRVPSGDLLNRIRIKGVE